MEKYLWGGIECVCGGKVAYERMLAIMAIMAFRKLPTDLPRRFWGCFIVCNQALL